MNVIVEAYCTCEAAEPARSSFVAAPATAAAILAAAITARSVRVRRAGVDAWSVQVARIIQSSKAALKAITSMGQSAEQIEGDDQRRL